MLRNVVTVANYSIVVYHAAQYQDRLQVIKPLEWDHGFELCIDKSMNLLCRLLVSKTVATYNWLFMTTYPHIADV